jgi:RNA polymerase sigma-70 factor (ECF subfamily)
MDQEENEPTHELQQLFNNARAAWPEISLELEVFAVYCQSLEIPTVTNVNDLYLACACSEGNAAALAVFDKTCLIPARDAIARIDRSPHFIDEVLQLLSHHLLVGPEAKIRTYRGTGPLAGWVRTAAVRAALNLRRSDKRQEAREEEALPALDRFLDPEVAVIRKHHEVEINSALKEAIERLPAGDRLLLRLYYVDDLTLAKIAALQKIAIATVSRKLIAATKTVLAEVKQELAHRLRLSADSLDSLIRDVNNDINISLSRLLRR